MAQNLLQIVLPAGFDTDIRHLVEEGKHLMIADQPDEMASKIGQLLEDPALWARLQCNSRELIRKQYTWRQLFENMHRTIDKAFKQHQTKRTRAGTSTRQQATNAL